MACEPVLEAAPGTPGLGVGQIVIVTTGGIETAGTGQTLYGVADSVDGPCVTLRHRYKSAPMTFVSGRAVEMAVFGSDDRRTASIETCWTAPEHAEHGTLKLRIGSSLNHHTERRAWTRVPIEVPVCISAMLPDGIRNLVGTTRDVSIGGFLMHTFAPVPNELYVAVMHLDSRRRLTLLAKALEIFRPDDGERGWMARFHFAAPAGPASGAIEDFVVGALFDRRLQAERPTSGCDDLAYFRTVTRRNVTSGEV